MIARKRSSLPSLTTTWLLFPPQLSHQRCVCQPSPVIQWLCPALYSYELVHPGTEATAIAEHTEEDNRRQARTETAEETERTGRPRLTQHPPPPL